MRNIWLIMAVVFLLASCTSVNKKQNDEKEQASKIDKFEKDMNEISPAHQGGVDEINAFVKLSGASFMANIINNPENVNNYKVTPYLAAANMGIYTADVLYTAAYKRNERAKQSYDAAKELADFIEIGNVFDEIFLKRLEDGLSEDDSVMYKLNEALNESKTVLKDKDQLRLFTAMTLGSHIEKLYIVNNIIFNYTEDIPDDVKLLVLRQSIMVLANQIQQAVKLTELFETYKPETEKANVVYEKMKEISAIYEPLHLKDNIQSMDPKMIFENEELLKGFEKVKEVRSMLILQ